MKNEDKNLIIKQTIKQTRERHGHLRCDVYELKVVHNKLSRVQINDTNKLFCEAKWMRNYIVADFEHADRNAKTVPIKTGDVFEDRTFSVLGSQMKQDIYDQVKANILSLNTNKRNGRKVGALKFKSVCNCVPLRQYGNTYKIDREHSTVKVVNIKKPFKVRGLDQLPECVEFANAKFIRKASGLYFHITVYEPYDRRDPTGAKCGVDFGIKDNITTSDGDTYNVYVPVDRSTRIHAKKFNRAFVKNGRKKTKNHYKRLKRLKRSYEHEANKRHDKANKISSELLNYYDIVVIQDEMIHNWHSGLFGKQVQFSAMGSIKARLKTSPRVIVVPRSFPSTQVCPICGGLTKHALDKREYNCHHCGYHHPSRDVKAAISIRDEGLRIGSS